LRRLFIRANNRITREAFLPMSIEVPFVILVQGDQLKTSEMGLEYVTYREEERCTQGLSGET